MQLLFSIFVAKGAVEAAILAAGARGVLVRGAVGVNDAAPFGGLEVSPRYEQARRYGADDTLVLILSRGSPRFSRRWSLRSGSRAIVLFVAQADED